MDIIEEFSTTENTLIDLENSLDSSETSIHFSSEDPAINLEESLPADSTNPDEIIVAENSDLETISEESQVNEDGSDPVTGETNPEISVENLDDSETLDESEVASSEFDSGVFTVGENGEIEIDFLFDGGKYKGELALFSLEDLDAEPGSEAFIKEAASRALSSSELGHIVIYDSAEGSRFSGVLGDHEEENWNGGEHQDGKIFTMNPGDEFGILFVPNGKVQEVYDDPSLEGSKRPLFSMTTANPDDIFEEGLIADLTGCSHSFAMEDAWGPDQDYNDLLFEMRGATGDVVLVDDVINSELDWRETELGQDIFDYIMPAPVYESGVFTVGESGEVDIDFLFDGGKWQGELAIFNLEGMDAYELGCKTFIEEAAARALSSSELGHVVISDPEEGARFTGILEGYEDEDWNKGEYQGIKGFEMTPGDEFGFMFIPNGTVEEVLENPDVEGSKRPLFSMISASSDNEAQFVQLVNSEEDGNSFAFEDRADLDYDYNDLIFQVQGATTQAPLLNDVITSDNDWRNDGIGLDVMAHATANEFGPLKNVGLDLGSLFVEYETHLRNGGTPSEFESTNSLLQVQDGYVIVDALASGDTNTLLLDLQALGLEKTASLGRYVSGLLPIEAIDEVSTLESLQFAKPFYRLEPDIGVVDSQGDVSMNANDARAIFGIDGTGVTVGVLSDSYNNPNSADPNFPFLTDAADDIASGDLPGGINALDDTWIGKDEGRAMLQIIHDVAPGANLAFHTANGGTAKYAQGIAELSNAGADVIVDDVRLFDEPMFQDGLIAQAVDSVVADGVSYFASAGNYGRLSYENAFSPSGQFLPNVNGELHDFDSSSGVDTLQQITIPANTGFTASFQWDSPLFSVSGGSGSPNNLNIYLFDSTGTNVLSRGETNNINGDPIEVFRFQNNGNTAQQFNLVISNAGGPNPGLVKYVLRNFSGTIDEYNTASGTGYGHSNATGAMAVGAAFYTNTPEFGQNLPRVEPFSSAYPVPILFDAAGNRLETPIIRQKPNFVAPDGTNTTFFGQDTTSDTDNFPNFFGTSAAAPHAAAVAALMLQAVPGADPTNIYSALSDTAIDMDDPFTSGSGLIQADLAVEEIQALEIPTVSITTPDSSASEEGDQGSFVVTRGGGSIISDLTINYTTSGTAINRSDYSLSGIVTIPAGATSAVIPVIPIDDTEFERNEVVEVFLSSSSNYNLEANTSIPVEIIDNDPAIGTVYVTIHTVVNLDEQEGGNIQGAPDFYTWFDIAGQREKTGTVTGSVIFPTDWTASYFNESGDDIIPITIDLKESDRRNDDHVDLSPRLDKEDSGNLIFWYNARTNEIFGDVNGFGGEVLFASGAADGSANFDDNDAAIWFTVDFVS